MSLARSVRGLGSRLPTRRDDWRLTARFVRLVLTIPGYALFAGVAAAVALSAFVLSQNLTLVADLVVGGSLPLSNRLRILAGLYPFLGTSYSALTGVALLLVAVLVGVDLAMVTYHVREHGLGARESGGSAVGVTLGMLGAGCAACGSTVLAGLFSVFGASGALLLLPLEGLEFSLFALVALLLSMYWIADGMRGGEVNGCPVDVGRR
ncbi:hypothetical protein ACFO0N_06140 [Halobium salinum]|uniref:DUF4013 domain-containing protein n=1 Tax=Halobium salinum TaxID=1364940 RepID=A0ABD5P9G0_9EURY|nr:hypothetical protein [Halobium salinum]